MFITTKKHQQVLGEVLERRLNEQERRLETRHLQELQRLERQMDDLRQQNKDLHDRLAARDWLEYKNVSSGLHVDDMEQRETDDSWVDPEDAPPEEALESLLPPHLQDEKAPDAPDYE